MHIPKKQTFQALLKNSIALYADRPALAFVGETALTYSDVNSKVNHLQALLAARGVDKGDRIVLLSQNMPNWGIAYLAVTGMGAVVVPVLTDFSQEEIAKIIAHSAPVCVIVSEKQSVKLHQSLPDSLKTAVLIDDFTEISLGALEHTGKINKLEWDRSIHVESVEVLLPQPEENDLAAILYTSGTTGNPKGVMLSHRNIISNAINTLGIQNIGPDDVLLSVLPLPHTYECTIGFIIPFMRGAVVNYLNALPTPAVLLPALQKIRPTMMLTVPLIIEKIYKNKVVAKFNGSPLLRNISKYRPVRKVLHKIAGRKIYKAFGGRLHFFGIGGAKLDPVTEMFLRDAGFPYAIGYGLTETSPLLAGCSPGLTRHQSAGFNIPGQEVKILNPDPKTGEGEIIARGPNVMMGYYKEPDITRGVFTEDGWFKTGDLGCFDEDGYLYIKGRIKNIILSASGENIYPEDIEAVINGEHSVVESLVYEWKGKLVARVHLNYEEIDKRYHEVKELADQHYHDLKLSADQKYHEMKESAGQSYQEFKDSASQMYEQIQEKVANRLETIKERVNARLNRYSKLAVIVEQQEPFEKTPTKKIRRFLYLQD